MSFLIVQLDYYKNKLTKKYNFLKKYCQPSVIKYAKKHSIDYHCIYNNCDHDILYSQKINLYKDIFNNPFYNRYDKILYLDLDILIKPTSPNIFLHSFEHIAGCLALKSRFESGIQITKNILQTNMDNFYALTNSSLRPNGGVIIFNRNNIDKNIFNFYEEDIIEDEMYLSYKIAYRNLSFTTLSSKWNCRNLLNTSNAYYIHILTNLFNEDGIDNTRNLNMCSLLSTII